MASGKWRPLWLGLNVLSQRRGYKEVIYFLEMIWRLVYEHELPNMKKTGDKKEEKKYAVPLALSWLRANSLKMSVHPHFCGFCAFMDKLLRGLVSSLVDTFITFWKSIVQPSDFQVITLQWHHNGHDSISNHQPHDCLLNCLFRCRSKKTSKLRVTGLCAGNHRGPVNSPHKWPVMQKMFPFNDVFMSSLLSEMVWLALKVN